MPYHLFAYTRFSADNWITLALFAIGGLLKCSNIKSRQNGWQEFWNVGFSGLIHHWIYWTFKMRITFVPGCRGKRCYWFLIRARVGNRGRLVRRVRLTSRAGYSYGLLISFFLWVLNWLIIYLWNSYNYYSQNNIEQDRRYSQVKQNIEF